MTTNFPTRQYLTGVVAITAVVLIIPLVAMQFTDQMDWTASDFVVAAALLLGSGAVSGGIAAKLSTTRQRVVAVSVVMVVLAAVWVQLAAGILD